MRRLTLSGEGRLQRVPNPSEDARRALRAYIGTMSTNTAKAPTNQESPSNGTPATKPVMLGIVGDSATGKTTLTRGIGDIFGRDRVTISVPTTITATTVRSARTWTSRP